MLPTLLRGWSAVMRCWARGSLVTDMANHRARDTRSPPVLPSERGQGWLMAGGGNEEELH